MCWRGRSAIPREIVRCLVEQVTGTVRWRESVRFMAQAGVTSFYELGAGKVLSGLIKRIADAATAASIGTPDDISRVQSWRAAELTSARMQRTANVRSHRQDRAGDRRNRPHRRQHRPHLHAQGATVAISGTRRDVLERWPAELGEPRPRAAVQSRRQVDDRGAGAARRRGHGAARYPGRQCRHHQRQSSGAIARRGLGPGHRRQSHRRRSAWRAPRCAA